jgi:hypothetical protein
MNWYQVSYTKNNTNYLINLQAHNIIQAIAEVLRNEDIPVCYILKAEKVKSP